MAQWNDLQKYQAAFSGQYRYVVGPDRFEHFYRRVLSDGTVFTVHLRG